MTHVELRAVSRAMRFDPIASFQKLNPALEAVSRPRIAPVEDESPVVQAVAQAINDVETEVAATNTVDERKRLLEEQKKITRAVIGRGVEGLKDGSMKISPKDLQNFMVMSQELYGFSFDEGGKARGVESVRVRFAREQESDLLVALRKDTKDINTIIQALWDQREQAKQHDIEVEAERKRLMDELG